MAKKPGIKPSARDETQEAFDRISRPASSTDCTGLVPGGVMNESDSEFSSELYDVPPVKAQRKEDK